MENELFRHIKFPPIRSIKYVMKETGLSENEVLAYVKQIPGVVF